MKRVSLCALLLAALAVASCSAVRSGNAKGQQPQIDLVQLCFALAPIQEPEVDVGQMQRALDRIVAKARKELEGADSPAERVRRLNDILLTGREVTYISNKAWRDSTLAASLLRRKGNCLSTATLYAVVGQRLGLPVRVVVVPRHALARYDDGETRINIETTYGGAAVSDAALRSARWWPDVESELLGYGRSLTDREFAATLHRTAARHLLESRRPKAALAEIVKAKALWPGNPWHELFRVRIIHKGLGRVAEARRGYAELAARTESVDVRTTATLELAGMKQAAGKHREALADLRRAYRDAPKYHEAAVLSMMASSYRSLRRFDEALTLQELAALLEGDGDDFVYLAILYKNASRLDDAIRCLRVALEMNPEDWNTRLILAGYLIRAGKKTEGRAMFKTVRKPRVGQTFFHTNMAWFFGSVGKKKEFLEHLGKALELSKTPHILNYIKTEVDFDRYRNDADFRALVERHRKRLMGAE